MYKINQQNNNITFRSRIGVPQNLKPVIKNAIMSGEIPSFFVPTPTFIGDLMIKELNKIKPHEKILEPSAGYGHIIDSVIKNTNVKKTNIDAVEPIEYLRDIIKKKGVNLVSNDILKYNPGQIYDKVIMNPPFFEGADVLHVLHCYKLLKPKGKLAAILPESAFLPPGLPNSEKWKKDWLNDGRSMEINQYLQELLKMPGVKYKITSLGEKFKNSDVPDDVRTKLLIITKPPEMSCSNYIKKTI